MKSRLAIAALSLSLLASVASATPRYASYSGLSYGSDTYEVNNSGVQLDIKENATILFAGQQLNKYAAVEVGFVAAAGASQDNTVKTYFGLEASLLGFIPLTSKVSVFGRVGSWTWRSFEDNLLFDKYEDPAAGLGIEYNPIRRLQIRIEGKHLRTSGDDKNINLINGSIGFRF